ncbi:MAG TPA: hypothetical protein VNL37_04770, partial [Candidatus Polarisedimenticolia bacterium]|nr:hypothetical protein [Candidatus Polarisedimenticolia bacterium]
MTDAPSTTRDGLATSAGPQAGRWRPLALLALLAVSFALYGRTLSYPFVLDDDQVIVRNAFVHHPGNPLVFFTSDYSRGTGYGPGYYRPLMMASFWLQGAALGWNPLWFHAVSVLLHGLVAWAVALLAAALGCSPPAACLGGLLFAVYPPGHAAVASVVARCDLLAVLFLILAWRTQLRHEHDLIRTRRAAASIFVLSFLAMAGKENGAVICGLLPLTALFYALRRRGRHHARARPDRLILCGTVLAALL